MPTTHTVVQGEHLAQIARQYGFADHRVVWEHAQNAELRRQRTSPSVLLPGDNVFIPDVQSKEVSKATEQRHTLQVLQRNPKLRLSLETPAGKPVANVKCTLAIGADTFELKTDGGGNLEHEIPLQARAATLLVHGSGTTLDEVPITILIGHLDPVSTLSGQVARLANLGYRPGQPTDVKDRTFLSAVEEFQCDQNLTVDGVCGPRTQAKLEKVHGS